MSFPKALGASLALFGMLYGFQLPFREFPGVEYRLGDIPLPPDFQEKLFLSDRRGLHAGRADRRGDLSRTLRQLAEERSAVDPRPDRISLHPQRGHLLRAPDRVRARFLAADAHGSQIVPLRDSRPRDDLTAAAGPGRVGPLGGRS